MLERRTANASHPTNAAFWMPSKTMRSGRPYGSVGNFRHDTLKEAKPGRSGSLPSVPSRNMFEQVGPAAMHSYRAYLLDA